MPGTAQFYRPLIRAVFLAVAVLAAAVVVPGVANADPSFTFAQFKLDQESATNVVDPFFLDSATGGSFFGSRTDTSNTVGAIDVTFSFLNINSIYVPKEDIKATLLITMTSNTAATSDGFAVSQMFGSGHFEIISKSNPSTNPAVPPGMNLLSGDFSNVRLTGVEGGAAGAIIGATMASAISFTSDYLLFGTGPRGMAISLSSITPEVALQNYGGTDYYRSFQASGTGTFSAEIKGIVPEPGSFALLGLGVVTLVGVRRRRAAR